MLYSEYMYKAKDCVIIQSDEGVYFLDPEWKMTLYSQDLVNPETVEAPYPITWAHVEDVLKLEVEKLNKINDKQKIVMDWLYELITAQVEPTIMQEETDYISKMLEYLKFKEEHPDIVENIEDTPKGMDDKVKKILQSGMTFAKK